MLPKLHLISHILCPYVQRAIITLLEKDIPHERTYIDLTDKPEWFRRISPLGNVPLLVVDDREVLFESAVICEYLNEVTPGTLHPAAPLERARHRAWIEFGSAILKTIAGLYSAPDGVTFEQKRLDLVKKIDWLERHLSDRPYFAGEQFSLVDAVYGPIFRYFDALEAIADFQWLTTTPNVQTWRLALQAHPAVKNAVVDDYPQRLQKYLRERNSYLASIAS